MNILDQLNKIQKEIRDKAIEGLKLLNMVVAQYEENLEFEKVVYDWQGNIEEDTFYFISHSGNKILALKEFALEEDMDDARWYIFQSNEDGEDDKDDAV